MAEEKLQESDIETLKIMADFFLRINLGESAYRTLKVILANVPNDVWSLGMLVRTYDCLKKYDDVLSLTENIAIFESEPKIKESMLLLRARALMKLGDSEASENLVNQIISSK